MKRVVIVLAAMTVAGTAQAQRFDELLFTITGDKVHVRQSMDGEFISDEDYPVQ